MGLAVIAAPFLVGVVLGWYSRRESRLIDLRGDLARAEAAASRREFDARFWYQAYEEEHAKRETP